MRIVHVIGGLPKAAGTSVFCMELCDEMKHAGEDVRIAVIDLDSPDQHPSRRGVPIIPIPSVLAAAWRPEIAHIHGLWSPRLHKVISWAKSKKIPIVLSPHGMLAPWALKHKWLKKKLAWWLYQKRDLQGAAMLHVTAESEIKWLRDLGFKQPCVLAPLGSDLPILTSAETQRRRDVKTVLFVGRIYPVKGLINLVRAWAEVKKSSLVHYCESALVGNTGDGEQGAEDGGKRPEDRERVGNKQSATGGGDVSNLPGPSTNELMNSRTNELPFWQLVIAGPDQAGHKAEVVAEAERLGLTVSSEPLTVNRGVTRKDAKAQSSDHVKEPQKLNATDGSPLTAYGSTIPDLIFTGPVYGAEKDALHRLADLFVLPSFTENFGVVVTDALSYGIPVITTKGTPWAELLGNGEKVNGKPLTVSGKPLSDAQHGGGQPLTANHSPFTDFTANGRCGWWIDIGVEPLAATLREAMALSDEQRQAMGENGRRLVEAKYTWPAIAADMQKAYAWLFAKGPAPTCVRLG